MSYKSSIAALKSSMSKTPGAAALYNMLEYVYHASAMLPGEAGKVTPKAFDSERFTLSASFSEPYFAVSFAEASLKEIQQYISNTPLYDQVYSSNSSEFAKPDGIFGDFLSFAQNRLDIINKIRHNEIVHRALFYEYSTPQFAALYQQDLLARTLNKLFDIDNELIGDERAYLQKVESKCYSAIDDVTKYMHFDELRNEQFYVSVNDVADFYVSIQGEKALKRLGISAEEQRCEKVSALIRDIYAHPTGRYDGEGLCTMILRREVEHFRDLSSLVDNVVEEDVFGLACLAKTVPESIKQADLGVLENKLIYGQKINQQFDCDVEKLHDNSLEYQSQMRRECIFSAIHVASFQFLNAIARYKSAAMIDIAADLLTRAREIALKLQLLQTVNEIFWFIATAMFCSGITVYPQLVHSTSEFHCTYHGRYLLLLDSEIEVERLLRLIDHADEQEFLFELGYLCENQLAVRSAIYELFTLFCKCECYHDEIIVLMCTLARSSSLQLNKNLASYLQESAKYTVLVQRKFKHPNYSRSPAFDQVLSILAYYSGFLYYDIKKQFVVASLFESARLELFYVYNFKLQASEPLNNIYSIPIYKKTLKIIGLYQAAQSSLREIGSEIAIDSAGEGSSQLELDGIDADLSVYTVLQCFREFGNSRFLYNFDCHELVRIQYVVYLLKMGTSRVEFDDRNEADVLEHLQLLEEFLTAKIDYLLNSNVIPFRKLNIKAQRQIFGIILSKLDYFSGYIDEIVSANLPITTSSIFLTYREKNNIPELLVDYVYLLAFCQFIWSQEQYYKERQTLIYHFTLVQFNQMAEFDNLSCEQLQHDVQVFKMRNKLLTVLCGYSKESDFYELLELSIPRLFISDSMRPPCPQQIATLQFDTTSESIILLLTEWWQNVWFVARFKRCISKSHALFPYKPIVLHDWEHTYAVSYNTADVEVLLEQLKASMDSTLYNAERMLRERLELVKHDSEYEEGYIEDLYGFLRNYFDQIWRGKDVDFMAGDGLYPMLVCFRYVKYLKHALFERYITKNHLKLTEMHEFGLYWFSGREKMRLPAGNTEQLTALLGEIDTIRKGADTTILDQHDKIVLPNGKTYNCDNLRFQLCRNWLAYMGIAATENHASNLEAVRQYFLGLYLKKEYASYSSKIASFCQSYESSGSYAPSYAIPLPGLTGVSDLESAQFLYKNFAKFTFMEATPLRNFFERLVRSCRPARPQGERWMISNWEYALLKRYLLRDVAHYMKYSRFYLKDAPFQNQYSTALQTSFAIPTTACAGLAAQCVRAMLCRKSVLEAKVLANRTALEGSSRATAEASLHRLQTRIWQLSWLSQAYKGQLYLQREYMEILVGNFYWGFIGTMQTRLLMAEEQLQTLKDETAQRARIFVASRRLAGLQAMGEKARAPLFAQIAALDEELQNIENQVCSAYQRLRKMQVFCEIRRISPTTEEAVMAALQMAEKRRADTICFYLSQIVSEKQLSAYQQISQLQNSLARACAKADEAQQMANARASRRRSLVEAVASKIAAPQKLVYDIQQINERLQACKAQNQRLEMQIAYIKQQIVVYASETEQRARDDKHGILYLRQRKAALVQHIYALHGTKEMLYNNIEQGIRQSETDIQQSIAYLGRRLQYERVKCRNAEAEYKRNRSIVDQFEEEAERRKNGLFL